MMGLGGRLLLGCLFYFSVYAVAGHPDPACSIEIRKQNLSNQLQSVGVSTDQFEQWLAQFPESERASALALAERLDLIDYPRFLQMLKQLGQKLQTVVGDLKSENVVFSRGYVAKSGDLVSYFFRRVNEIPATHFVNLESRPSGDTLVLLDDYTGTGTQLLVEVLARKFPKVLPRFRKIVLAFLVANDRAITRFDRFKSEGPAALEEIIQEFHMNHQAARAYRTSLSRLDPKQFEFVFVHRDVSFTDSEKELLVKHSGTYPPPFGPLGVGNLASRTVFWTGPPNTVPYVFWNPQGKLGEQSVIPLFARTEDISVYGFSKAIPPEYWIWGRCLHAP